VINMPVEPADLVIRVGTLPDSDLIARHLLTTEAWTCASPGYIAACGMPSSVADLGRYPLNAYADRPTTWSYRMVEGAIEHVEFQPAHVVSDPVALEPMLIGGGGVGRLPDFIARRAVAEGKLVRLFPQAEGDMLDVHALYTSHRSLSAKVRVFIDALIEHLAVVKQTYGPWDGGTAES